jgi:hypothetical protein
MTVLTYGTREPNDIVYYALAEDQRPRRGRDRPHRTAPPLGG